MCDDRIDRSPGESAAPQRLRQARKCTAGMVGEGDEVGEVTGHPLCGSQPTGCRRDLCSPESEDDITYVKVTAGEDDDITEGGTGCTPAMYLLHNPLLLCLVGVGHRDADRGQTEGGRIARMGLPRLEGIRAAWLCRVH